MSGGYTITAEPGYSRPDVQVTIRAAGLAAESLVYRESYQDLMNDPSVRSRIKTDTDNAKCDLEKAGLCPRTEDEFVNCYWKTGFGNASGLLQERLAELRCIADYCAANQGREIPRSEIVTACNL